MLRWWNGTARKFHKSIYAKTRKQGRRKLRKMTWKPAVCLVPCFDIPLDWTQSCEEQYDDELYDGLYDEQNDECTWQPPNDKFVNAFYMSVWDRRCQSRGNTICRRNKCACPYWELQYSGSHCLDRKDISEKSIKQKAIEPKYWNKMVHISKKFIYPKSI